MLIGFCGPSAVGKTTIMRALAKAYGWKFVRVATTRPIRDGEVEKFQVSRDSYDSMNGNGSFWCSNTLFGNSYGTLKNDIEHSKSTEDIYMLDWPITKVTFLNTVAHRIFLIVPETEEQLANQAVACGRGDRLDEIISDFRLHYSTAKLHALISEQKTPMVLLKNCKSADGNDSVTDICQYILTEISQQTTT